jgi:hypothetical protein
VLPSGERGDRPVLDIEPRGFDIIFRKRSAQSQLGFALLLCYLQSRSTNRSNGPRPLTWVSVKFQEMLCTEDPHRGLFCENLALVVVGKYRMSLRVEGCCFL